MLSCLLLQMLTASPTITWEELAPASVKPTLIVAGPRFRHVSYAESKDGKQRLVINGKEQPFYDEAPYALFSEDGESWFYTAKDGASKILIIDGQFVERDIHSVSLFSRKPLVYSIRVSPEREVLKADGEIVAEGKTVQAFVTPKGEIAYFVEQPDKTYKVQAGDKTVITPAGTTPQFYLMADGKWFVDAFDAFWLDGTPYTVPGMPEGETPEVVVSLDNKNIIAWYPQQDDRIAVHYNGKLVGNLPPNAVTLPDETFIGGMLFEAREENVGSGKEAVTVYRATAGGVRQAVPHRVRQVLSNSYVESADGKSYALIAGYEGYERNTVIRDGKVVFDSVADKAQLDNLAGLGLSPDGRRLAWVAGGFRNYDGKPVAGPYETIATRSDRPSIAWSPDSNHFAYVAEEGGTKRVYLNGQPTDAVFEAYVVKGELEWLDQSTLAAAVVKEGKVYRLIIKV
jgi:hypothetical protein